MAAPTTRLSRLHRAARWTGLRLRIDTALGRAVALAPIVLLYAIAALTYIKVARPGPELERSLLAGLLVPALVWLVGTAHVFWQRRSRYEGALALDRYHKLDDRIASALFFRQLPAERRTPFMHAAIEDALQAARALKPRRAAPFHVPAELPIVGVLIAALIGISLLEVRTYRALPPTDRFEPLVMTADDLELFDQLGSELAEQSSDPEVQAAVRRFNQLIEDIAQRRLDRPEVFQRLEQLERELSKSAEADKQALEEGLKALAKELEASELSKPVADALKDKRLPDAEKAMRELAEKLKKQRDVDKKQLEKLRKALQKASQTSAERLKNIEARRQELEETKKRLLKKKQEQGKLDAKDEKKLADQERRLERLEREREQAKRQQRQMSEIDKKLAEAARKLQEEMRKAGMAGDDLEQAAEDMKRQAQKELSDEQKKRLAERLEELRELLRQQGAGGKQRMQRMQRFSERARGQKGQGQQGQGQGRQGQEQGPGQLMPAPGGGGQPIPIPGAESGPSAAQSPGTPGAQGDKKGGGGQLGGQKWGDGHDSNLKGEAQAGLKGQTKDVTAAGVDSGEGSASSEVIYGAAQRGFTGRGYQKVYTDYKNVAERVIDKDEIPPGYRFYVQRYFQLIRPRE